MILQTDLHSDIPLVPPPTPEPTMPQLSLYDELLTDLHELISPNQQNPADRYYQQPLQPDLPTFLKLSTLQLCR